MDFAVIMAGGTGKRLWPLSRESKPKQVLKILDGQTLLRRCFDRLTPIFDIRNIIVQCNAGFADLVRENLPELPRDNVIAEPAVRDTAGAIGLSAAVLSSYDPDATMVVVTADQLITPDVVFQSTVRDGISFVNHNKQSLVTFSIEPTFASTQYGYIELGSEEKLDYCENPIYKVDSFTEKPAKDIAERYIESGNYTWNSGMFVWKARTILDKLYANVEDARKPLEMIKHAWGGAEQEQVLEDWFVEMPKISIDYAVMEKDPDVYSLRMSCDWLDLGSFAALADVVSSDENENVVVAKASKLLDCKDNIVVTEDNGHLIAGIGLENMVIAHSPDATLVCPRDQAYRLKELLEVLGNDNGKKYL